jgi:hypothetical protein
MIPSNLLNFSRLDLAQRFGHSVSNVIVSVNGMKSDHIVLNEFSNVEVFDFNVFASSCSANAVCDCNNTFVIHI